VNAPLGLSAYRSVSAALSPLAGPLLRWRARAGKEEEARLGERFGIASAPRPAGPLVWLHGASLGEARVLLALADALAQTRPDLSFLITTGTTTSAADIANARRARLIHQYAPLDMPAAAKRFLAHWRPDLAVFVESELWPNLLRTTKAAGVKLALVNARLSEKSLANWGRFSASAACLLACYDRIFAVDSVTAAGLSRFTPGSVEAIGNLKLAAPAPRVDEALLAKLRAEAAGRKIWLAASTHEGEEEIALAAHAALPREARPLLVIAPRHPARGEAIAALAGGAPRRSQGAGIGEGGVYVCDTIGELGALFTLAPVTVMGGSLLPVLRGHNPIEPAKIGSAILSGPHVASFADLYRDFFAAGAARKIEDARAMAEAVRMLWSDETAHAAQVAAARTLAANGGAAMSRTIEALLALLEQGRAHAAA
jgi:3-deoxy-D-manno-octulosonic-acid transferase